MVDTNLGKPNHITTFGPCAPREYPPIIYNYSKIAKKIQIFFFFPSLPLKVSPPPTCDKKTLINA